MADDIAFKVSNLRITVEEDRTIVFEGDDLDENKHDLAASLVVKILTVRSYNFKALKRTLNQIWAISKGAIFRKIENDLFVVHFACKRDRDKVLVGRPWTFDQSLVMLQEIDEDIQPSNIAMKSCPFRVHLYNLPMRNRSENHIRMIGGCITEVLNLDFDGIMWDKSAHLKILVDVTQSLRRAQCITMKNGTTTLVEIKYERLPTFYFTCGVIGHIERDCLKSTDDGREEEKQWGAWLRASPRKRRQRLEEETK
ncbi:uncharacterized protein LOC104894942 [Beta vulgaris subsp. vulgaris]|uniref:uncharacterized protein LOC104894942 n=1 Tax=Beta vulgaris subsp. vulgaris TaxID=3555 RepID=UPI00053F3922|nr:uncharacterized protein LOC104894942 [Beta vulgaris subsp. vulgaris]